MGCGQQGIRRVQCEGLPWIAQSFTVLVSILSLAASFSAISCDRKDSPPPLSDQANAQKELDPPPKVKLPPEPWFSGIWQGQCKAEQVVDRPPSKKQKEEELPALQALEVKLQVAVDEAKGVIGKGDLAGETTEISGAFDEETKRLRLSLRGSGGWGTTVAEAQGEQKFVGGLRFSNVDLSSTKEAVAAHYFCEMTWEKGQ